MSSEAQWFTQLAAAAVCGWALGKVVVEIGRGLVAAAWRHYRRRPA